MVRTILVQHLDFVGYQQDNWVAAQHYQQADWRKLIKIWVAYNEQIAHIIHTVSSDALKHTLCINGGFESYTLEFIMADYVEHLKHHLRTVLPDAGFESNFANVYNV